MRIGLFAATRFLTHATTSTLAVLWLVASTGSIGYAGEGDPTVEQIRFFERSVRPVLAENCFKCHGEQKQKGGLRLDSREALLAGGDSGPVVAPGKPDESLLIEAIHYDSLEMPPAGKLPEPAIAALVEWVKLGAPWPASPAPAASEASAKTGAKSTGVRRGAEFTAEDRAWWSFQSVRDPAVPTVDDHGWARGPIDRFLFQRLQAEGLTPAPEADKLTLIRRATFDVTGLPPTPQEIDAYLADRSPNAYEAMIDRLLASPRYGERWARHWLDLVRYADSDGYRIDHVRPRSWLYRDYVVRAFNDDKPYDRFVQEQIAGDELFPDSPDALTATGFFRHGIYEYNNRDVPGQWGVMLDDVTDTASDVFLGLGLQCARCHNHKFDPLLQADYYRLRAFFAPILPHDDLPAAKPSEIAAFEKQQAVWEAKTAGLRAKIESIEARYRPKVVATAVGRFPDDLQAVINTPVEKRRPLEQQLAELAYRQVVYDLSNLDAKIKGKDKDELLALRKQLAAFDKEKPRPLPIPMTVRDVGPEAPPVTIPKKGDETVAPGFPTILAAGPATIEPLPAAPRSTGRRAALARWLTQAENPLSTRVIVNRIWQYHFGRGLAANSSDFGRLGEAPSHPELLDWLTTRFVRDGWKLKPLHRLILTSAAYRQSTAHPAAVACQVKDPENRLYWRGNTRRLDAEQIRDAILAVSGELDRTVGGPGANGTDLRLSIYTRVLRNIRDPLLDVFDLPLFFNSTPSRDTTTTPLQSLLLINSQMMRLRAEAFAQRLERERGGMTDPVGLLEGAYRLAFGRGPTRDEIDQGLQFLREQAVRIDPGAAGSADAAFLRDKIPYRDGKAAVLSLDGPQRKLEVRPAAPLTTGDFTIEGYFLLHSIDDGGAVRTVVSQWDGSLKTPGWSFGVTGRGSRRKPQTLVLQLVGRKQDGGFGEAAVFSDQLIQLDRPYYAAASIKLAGPASGREGGKAPGTVTFYLKDLSNDDEPLLVATVPHPITGGVVNTLPLTLGCRSAAQPGYFDGLVDDLRLSDGALDVGQLLYSVDGVGRRALGYWRFEAEPGVFHDSSGHGLDLQLGSSHERNAVDPARAALIDFCHVLLNSNEFLYVH